MILFGFNAVKEWNTSFSTSTITSRSTTTTFTTTKSTTTSFMTTYTTSWGSWSSWQFNMSGSSRRFWHLMNYTMYGFPLMAEVIWNANSREVDFSATQVTTSMGTFKRGSEMDEVRHNHMYWDKYYQISKWESSSRSTSRTTSRVTTTAWSTNHSTTTSFSTNVVGQRSTNFYQ